MFTDPCFDIIGRVSQEEPSLAQLPFLDVLLIAVGVGLTLFGAAAAIYASGFPLLRPSATAHLIPLWVIEIIIVTVVLLRLELAALGRGRTAPLVITAAAAVLAGIGVVVLSPTPSLQAPIGAALPWWEISLAAALLGAVTLLAVTAWRRRRNHTAGTPTLPVGIRLGLPAVAVALGLLAGLGIGAQRWSAAYLDGVNEYHTNPISSGGASVASALTGGMRWQVTTASVPRVPQLSIPYGIVITDGRAVTELDASTGRLHWRYERSDVDEADKPDVWALPGGQQLVVRWESGFFLLDARTGARLARWPSAYTDDHVDTADPTLLQGRRGDATTLTKVDDRGHRRWTYTTAGCHVSGVSASNVALVQLETTCGAPRQRLIGLDANTGGQRWSLEHGPVTFQAQTAAIAVISDDNDGQITSLTGLDLATGATPWTTTLRVGGRDCTDARSFSQGASVAVLCHGTRSATTSSIDWVQRYDISTGRLLDEVTLGAHVEGSPTVTADGRIVFSGPPVHGPACQIRAVQADRTVRTLAGLPTDYACLAQVQAVGAQVLLINVVTGQVGALR